MATLSSYKKLFGIGPLGMLITVLTFGGAWLLDHGIDHPQLPANPVFLRYAAGFFIVFGLFLHSWTFVTLRNWWKSEQLCIMGPFRYFRHPMYAAWMSFVSMGVALWLNSWVYVFWALLLHPIWHALAKREEKIVEDIFGDEYRRYAARTGRFVPRFRRRIKPSP